MAEIEVPDYKISRTIPSGSTVSLFPDNTHLHNMADVETKILFPENVNNWKEAVGNDNYWLVAYTMREYKKLAGDNVVPKQLKGDLRKVNGWEQTVLLPTSAEAINWLAYHNSQQHSQPDNDMVLVALKTTCRQKLVSFCQRAHSIQAMQLHRSGYNLDEMELKDLRVLQLTFNAANKFLVYKWSNDFTWYYGHPIHVTTMLRQWAALNNDEKDSFVHMSLEHLGLEGTAQLTREAQELIQQFRTHNRLDTSFVERPLQSQRGHNDHKNWIEDNSIWKDNGDGAEQGEDKKIDDKNDKDEDDKMEGSKKRRIEGWLTI